MKKILFYFLGIICFVIYSTFSLGIVLAAERTDINFALNVPGASMDPHYTGAAVDLQVQESIYESLYFVDEQSNVSPLLAENYSVSENGLEYTFNLREDVKFHNGEKLTASDVVWSYKRAKEAPLMAAYTEPIADVVALDDHTVRIILSFPYSPFIYWQSMIKIINEKAALEAGESFGLKPTNSGTGPYRLIKYEPSSEIVLEAFPEYYRGEARIKKVNISIIKDLSTALIAFQNGELDFCTIPSANWEEIESSGKYSTGVADTSTIVYMALNVASDGPLKNKLVRQAVNYAIDKESIIDIAADGIGTVADHMVRPGFISGAMDTDFVYNYNPEKAIALLKEAGYANGCDIGEIQTGSEPYHTISQVIQSQLAEVGIKASPQFGETTTMAVDWRKGAYSAIVNRITSRFTYDYIRRYNDSRIATVFMKYDKNPECDYKYIDNTFDVAAAELDNNKRDQLYLELEEYLLELSAYVPLYYLLNTYAWDKNLDAKPYIIYNYFYDWSWK